MLPAETATSRRRTLDLAAVREGMDAACGRYGWHDTLWRSAVRGAVAVLASPFASTGGGVDLPSLGGAPLGAGGIGVGGGSGTSRQIPRWRLPSALAVLGIDSPQHEADQAVSVALHELGATAAVGGPDMPLSEAVVERAARRLASSQLGHGLAARQLCRVKSSLESFSNRGTRPGFVSRSELAYALAGSAVEKAGTEMGSSGRY